MKNDITYYRNKSIFISATNTDVGKAYVCEKFLNYFARDGLKVGYPKLCETGVINNKPLDGIKMFELVRKLNPNFEKLSINDVVPYQFELPAAPYIASQNTNIDIEFLKEKKEYLRSFCDVLIMEGAGGLMVPLKKDIFMIDLINIFDSLTFLITPSELGSINDTLLSIEALKDRNIDFEFFINLYKDEDSFEKVSKPFLVEHLGNLNFLQDL